MPFQLTVIPLYIILGQLGWIDTILPLVVPKYLAADAFFIFLMVQFFRGIPRELDEAAQMDGCSPWRIYWKIIMPLSGPIVVYTALMSFMAPWTDFIAARIIMGDNYQKYTVAIGMYQMIEKNNINDNFRQFNAGCVCIGVPIIIMFIIMQRFYVGGVTSGAVKS